LLKNLNQLELRKKIEYLFFFIHIPWFSYHHHSDVHILEPFQSMGLFQSMIDGHQCKRSQPKLKKNEEPTLQSIAFENIL